MQIYRYKIDDVIYDPYDVGIEWRRANSVNPIIYQDKISGNIKFKGSAYDYIDVTDKVYFDFTIEQLKLSDSSWNEIWTGFFDIRTAIFNEQKKSIIISKFHSDVDIYEAIIKLFDTSFNWESLIGSTNSVLGTSTTSVTTFCDTNIAGAGLTDVQYRAAYDVDANALQNATLDPRWAYFLYTGVDINNVPVYETMAFKFQPTVYDYVRTEFNINGQKKTRYIKKPAVQSQTESYQTVISSYTQDIGTIIDNLLSSLSTGLDFDDANDIDYGSFAFGVDFKKVRMAVARNVGFNFVDNVKISLGDIMDLFENKFGLYWDIDTGTNHLKFVHPDAFIQTGTVDLTENTSGNSDITPIYPNPPDIERWKSIDSDGTKVPNTDFGIAEIEYDVVNFSDREIAEYTNNWYTNVSALLSEEIRASDDKFALLYITDETTTPYLLTYDASTDQYNLPLSINVLFTGLMYWRYWDDSVPTNKIKIGYSTYNRPLWRYSDIPYSQPNDELLTDIDSKALYTTTKGEGKLYEFKCDLKTNKKTITIDLFDLL